MQMIFSRPIYIFLVVIFSIKIAIAEKITPMNLTLDAATRKVLIMEQDSTVLNAITKSLVDKNIHIIKIITSEGLVKHIHIDVQTGQILNNSPK